ncbi:hypothetical protein BB561_003916 [Smittium simulii]|uniref:Uncharacterized protein n=1 Tax=Smittium simulii TaxID=133385 RepID=A0A2T9YIZ1_9FUNG|nr:hypothetical protein BB561_003916 [Smittium simulii]
MLVWNLLFLSVATAKMSGVSYNPLYQKICKTGTSLQDDVNIIAESANSVLVNFFTKCNIGETISKFAAKDLDIYLNVDAHLFGSLEDGQERFKDLRDKNVFRDIKGISVSHDNSRDNTVDLEGLAKFFKDIFKNDDIGVGVKFTIFISNDNEVTGFKNIAKNIIEYNKNVGLDYILLRVNILESSIDSTNFALKVFNEHFVTIQELQKPIYLQVEQRKKKLENESFFNVLRELECRQTDKINYFMDDSFGPDSFFKKNSGNGKLESLGKDSFDCKHHEYIGNWVNELNGQ